MILRPCRSCHRHLDERDAACRFCGVLQPASLSTRVMQHGGRLSRAALFAGLSACWTGSGAPSQSQPIQGERAHAADRTIGGIVVDHAGQPLAGVDVTVHHADGRVDTVKTNGRGEYVVGKLAAGAYRVQFRYETHVLVGMDEQPVTIGDAPARLNMVLPMTPRELPAMPYGAPPARRRLV